MIASLLEAHDIPSTHTAPLAPVLGFGAGGITIQVRASDVEQARSLLQ